VMYRKPRRLVDTRALKSSVVKLVKGFVENIPAFVTRRSMLPNF